MRKMRAHLQLTNAPDSDAEVRVSELSPRHCEELLRRSNPDCFRGGILDCSHGDLLCQDGWSALCSIASQLSVPTVGPFGWRAQVRSRPARKGRREAAW